MPTADSSARLAGAPAARPRITNTPSTRPRFQPAGTNLPSREAIQTYRSGGGYAGGGGGGGGGGYEDYSGGGGGGMMAPMSAPAAPSEEDYLGGDAGYQAQLAALLKALELYQADDTAQRTRYETDYGDAIKQLGWTPDDPKTAEIDESKWNWDDQNTASGRANQTQLNDFASRGMLQSSGYARSKNDLQRSFNDQLGSTNRARTDFISQRDRDLAAYKNENTSSSQQARAEALARRAAQYGL